MNSKLSRSILFYWKEHVFRFSPTNLFCEERWHFSLTSSKRRRNVAHVVKCVNCCLWRLRLEYLLISFGLLRCHINWRKDCDKAMDIIRYSNRKEGEDCKINWRTCCYDSSFYKQKCWQWGKPNIGSIQTMENIYYLFVHYYICIICILYSFVLCA